MKKVNELLENGDRLVLASVIKSQGSSPRGSGAKMIVTEDGDSYGTIGGGCVENYVFHEAKKVFNDGKMRTANVDLGDDSWSGIGMACGGTVELLIELIAPNPGFILLGAGHVAKVIANLANFVGYNVTVIDPLAEVEDFPIALSVIKNNYDVGLSDLSITSNDSIVILTRHHSDSLALHSSLNTDAGYIGMIGSKNRVKMVYDELLGKGFSEEKLLTVHAPVGLDIEAETPEEVAISIIAEIIMVKRGGKGLTMALKHFEEVIKQETQGEGLHVVYDSVGATTFDKSLKCLRPRGMLALYGASSGPVPPFDPARLAGAGSLFITRPTLNHYILNREELLDRSQTLFNLVEQDKLNITIDQELPLGSASRAHERLEGRKTSGKLLLKP